MANFFYINHDTVFDFSKVKFIEGNMCVVFDLIKQHNKDFKIKEASIPDYINELLERNGYFEKEHYKEDDRKTTVNITRHSRQEEEEFSMYIDKKLLGHQRMPELQQELSDSISALFSELFANVQQHTKSNYITTCGQFFPKSNKLIFSLGNLTNNFHEVIAVNSRADLNDIECIKWALKAGNSTKKDRSGLGGSGLAVLRQLIDANNGILTIVSGKGYYEEIYKEHLKMPIIKEEILDLEIPGTVITLTLDLNNNIHLNPNKPIKI